MLCTAIAELEPAKRQPNLLFAAARFEGVPVAPWADVRDMIASAWDPIRATMRARMTQTNEARRMATMLPAIAHLRGPIALVEVGASAGLCLYPDRYSYRFATPDSVVTVHPAAGPSPVVLDCRVVGDAPLPTALPEVVWRGGIDLNPLAVGDDDAMRWLRTLVAVRTASLQALTESISVCRRSGWRAQ